MSHHAFYYAGDSEKGVEQALSYAQSALGLAGAHDPDISIHRFGLFSVEDARKISDVVYRAPTQGSRKLIVIVAPRMFEQAQNALLKIFEEPPHGVTLVLVIPSHGILLPTLLSRLQSLSLSPSVCNGSLKEEPKNASVDSFTQQFIAADPKERAKLIAKLVDLSKSDNEETKQAARISSITFIENLIRYFYASREKADSIGDKARLTRFLSDLNRFMPLMHARSAPLKLIFEHILIVFPAT